MKRKILIVSLALICFMMVGCGKKDELADYYENELGIDREDAEELADEFAEMNYDEEDYAYEEEEASAVTLVSPSDEIVNSKITDMLVQVNNVVIPLDGTMTMQACFDALQADFGNVLSLDKGKTLDGLANSYDLDSLAIIDENKNKVCYLHYYNGTDNPVKLSDCMVVYVEDPGVSEIYSLNFFYSGNICAGSFIADKDIMELDEYTKRIEEYPILSYDTVPAYLETQGFSNVEFDESSSVYRISFIDSNVVGQMNGEDAYREFEISFGINRNTSNCRGITHFFSINQASAIANGSITRLENEKDIMTMDELAKTVLSEDAEMVAYYSYYYGFSPCLCLIYQMHDGTYTGVETRVYRLYNGEIETNYEPELFSEHTESIEQLAEDNEIALEDITMLK